MWGLMILATGAFAQQGQKVASVKSNTSASNPNIERMRIVNEKIAAEKATKANQTNEQRIAAINKRNAEIREREQKFTTGRTNTPTVRNTGTGNGLTASSNASQSVANQKPVQKMDNAKRAAEWQKYRKQNNADKTGTPKFLGANPAKN